MFYAFSFVINICFELTGKKSETLKLPWQSMKKKPLRITADSVQNVKKAQNSKKEVVDITVKEKISENTRRSVEGDKEARKCKHHDKIRHMECRTDQKSKALIKNSSKKHRMVDVNSQQLQQSQTQKVDYDGDLLQKYFVADSSDSVKKVKVCHSDRKLDQTHEETEMCADNLVEYQKKVNSGGLQHDTRTEQVDNHNRLQLLERHQKTDENVVRKSKTERTGSSKETVDRAERRAGVDKYCSARRKECSSDSARQHVRRALYRALTCR